MHFFIISTFSELRSVGVKVWPAEAGYYMMPDFEVCRPGLNRRGIKTGQQMAEKMLKEAKVAVSIFFFKSTFSCGKSVRKRQIW
jgi:aspartate/methionine/tyrosine aminotransferase